MEREELVKMREYQIGTASTEYYNKHPKADPISAFEDGVAWADEHPCNPWISVDERLPRDEEYDDENIYCFLVRQECGFIYNCAFDGEEWLTTAPNGEEWGVGGVTHWMPIPQAPKV